MKDMQRIYLDYAASTPVDPRVLEAMMPYWAEISANPHSIHEDGRRAHQAVEGAHRRVARVLGVKESEIIFTGSATEANNMVMFGIPRTGHVVVSAFEHPSIMKTLPILEARGYTVTKISPDEEGIIRPETVRAALRPDTVLVSIIHSHNEIGVIQRLGKIGHVISEHRGKSAFPYFHTDACQSATTLPLSPHGLGVDLMTINSAKVYGPKGVGALYMRHGIEIKPLLFGGGQERGMRSGTENVAGIVGFASALDLVQARRDDERERLTRLRDRAIEAIKSRIPDAELNGSRTERLANNINISIPRILNEQAVVELDVLGFSVSSGGACESGAEGGSYVIRALGKGTEFATSALRITLGAHTTEAHMALFVDALAMVVDKLRAQ